MLEAQNVTKIYKTKAIETKALKNVSLKIKKGEFVAIMGPSGSGKSTLMHIIGCLDIPTSGKVFFNEKDVSTLSDEELTEIRLKEIGFVFQAFNLLPRTTVLRNVTLPLIYGEVPKAKRIELAKKSLTEAGLSKDNFKHLSNQISGGQRQRVAIARALVNNPTIILADEPTGNLDTKTGEIILKTFQRLNRDYGRTIALITHEKYVAEHANRIVHILDGKIKRDSKNKNQRIIYKNL